MSDHPEFVCCTHRELPPELQLEAAWHAAVLRPSNAPGLVALAYDHPHDEPLPPESLIGLKSKFWPNGYAIRMAFQGGNRATNAKVLEFANHWNQYANISFIDVGLGDQPDVIVGYDQPGYWSNIGTDCRILAAQGQRTMNLQGFDSGQMSLSEWYRVIEHEPGHAIGLLHEQGRIGGRIDWPPAYAYFWQTQGWDRRMVDEQIPHEPPDPATVIESPDPDLISIMEYAFPASIMLDRIAVAGGGRISKIDIQTVAKIYPGKGPVHPTFPKLPDFGEAL